MSRTTPIQISVILPTYNEQDNIVPLVQKILLACKKHNILPEIIIVDDQSIDQTATQILKSFRSHPQVKLYVRKQERGLATAIYCGIQKATHPVIVGMDGDGNHLPQYIPKLVEQLTISQSDIVVASRFIHFQKDMAGMSRLRYVSTYVFNRVLQLLNFPTTDNMSGFYAVSKDTLAALPLAKIYSGYGEYHLRLLWHAQQKRFKITEISVRYGRRKHGVSKSNLVRMAIVYMGIALRLWSFAHLAIIQRWIRFHLPSHTSRHKTKKK